MGWEKRARGGEYYTRSRRVGGRMTREYIGAGPAGELAAQRDAAARAERHAGATALQAEHERLTGVEERSAEFEELTKLLVQGALLLAGYHQHHRGEWRRKRGE